ncbi:MAG TPA: glycosyltransferase family 1 protein [Tepidisphaeraceae bacterium]|nr:glycosyltransferase family 1 protein [Tepidisphaeraceae bacterium]
MRIGVNAFPLRAEGGGSRYVFAGLLSALLKLDSNHHYIIFAHFEALRLVYQVLKSHGETLGGTGPDPRVKVIHISDEGQIYGHRYEFDLLFGPLNNLNPRLYDRPSVAILHDIQEQYFPEYFSKSDLIGRMEVYPEICRAATVVVAISQFCKQTFVEKFGVDPAKVEVVPNAPQADLVSAPGEGAWTRQALPEKYLFYPANCYRHKNHSLLLDMVERLRNEGLRIPVIFSGFELPGGFPLRKEIASRGLGDLCQVFTDLPAEELRYLYRHSLAVALPTKFEGFGMPAVEAAMCGCPVVCSDLTALREILGDNAVYFDPNNLDDVCEKVRQITDDAPLRQKLSEQGQILAERFTWENSARRMLEIFNEARERFVWSRHKPNSVRRPRIGVSIRLTTHAGAHMVPTVESLLCTGYTDLVMRCEIPPGTPENLRKFLASAGVRVIETPGAASTNGNGSHHHDGYAPLQEFAREDHLDLVGEIIEGHRFKTSGLDSLAWGYLQEPDMPVQLGEAMEWSGEQFVGTARLRLTGDGLWKMEGYLYPELLFVNRRALEAWPAGLNKALAGGGEAWRWDLLREARREGRVFLSRRTLVDTDQLVIGPRANRSAAKAGMFHYYNVDSERSVKVRLLRRMEPVVKRAARVLPLKWQDAGTRLWYHLAR